MGESACSREGAGRVDGAYMWCSEYGCGVWLGSRAWLKGLDVSDGAEHGRRGAARKKEQDMGKTYLKEQERMKR